jgi:hypothetical protein
MMTDLRLEQQVCVTQEKNERYCTALGGLPAIPTKENMPQANDVQLAALQLLITSTVLFGQSEFQSFAASDFLWNGLIARLPDNQWEKEVTRWEIMTWAAMHHVIVDYATGPKNRDPRADDYVIPATEPGQKKLCQSLKVRKNGGFV